jgi:hypothetical protein
MVIPGATSGLLGDFRVGCLNEIAEHFLTCRERFRRREASFVGMPRRYARKLGRDTTCGVTGVWHPDDGGLGRGRCRCRPYRRGAGSGKFRMALVIDMDFPKVISRPLSRAT